MTEQDQHELRSDRDQQLRFSQQLRRVDGLQKGYQPKGRIINGTEGVGKTIAVETILSVIKDV